MENDEMIQSKHKLSSLRKGNKNFKYNIVSSSTHFSSSRQASDLLWLRFWGEAEAGPVQTGRGRDGQVPGGGREA